MRRIRSLLQGLPSEAGTWHVEPARPKKRSITPADLAGLFSFRVSSN